MRSDYVLEIYTSAKKVEDVPLVECFKTAYGLYVVCICTAEVVSKSTADEAAQAFVSVLQDLEANSRKVGVMRGVAKALRKALARELQRVWKALEAAE